MLRKLNKQGYILILILMLNLFLNVYGINWGLPNRWNVDEQVATSLRMLHEKSIVTSDDFGHPTFYYFFLILVLSLFIIFLKFIGYPLATVESAAAVSWIKLTFVAPDFAKGIYFIARFASCLLGVFSVYMVYLIGKRIFNKTTGLLSAAVLSMTMGFAAINHFAKYDSLLHLLMLITIYFCIKAIQGRDFKKYIFLASFFAGISMATKYNGAILVNSIITAYLLHKKREAGVSFKKITSFLFDKIVLGIAGLYILGNLIVWPGLLLNFREYLNSFLYYGTLRAGSPYVLYHSYYVNMVNYFIQITLIFGIPIFIFAIIGTVGYLFKLKKVSAEILILLVIIIPYFLIISSDRHMYHPCTRYIIAIIPFLSLFAGKALNSFLEYGINRILKILVIAFIFIFSFFYTLSADLTFVKDDTRYKATKWVLKNLPENSSIEMLDQIDWLVAADKIVSAYNINFFGNSSKDNVTRIKFKVLRSSNFREDYFKKLNISGIRRDYIMLVFLNASDIPYGAIDTVLTEESKFKYNLVNGKLNYRLVKQFSHPNDKLKSSLIRGLSLPRNIFWNPNPTDYTSPTILIFKKI
ncbi:MAG: glycosyltransferase family 39 protein [Candidatus Omnitrophota bacterium]